ncbi:MAG: right-handed parallel beta-helix repeat-containing protein, partial [Armatimonadetes bacterium]|nr:right-handed parallel beta-helix repeat-containing protein [Armatimonadota bacterium]
MKKNRLKTTMLTVYLLFASIAFANAVVFVSTTGNDANNGLTWATSKRTIQAGATLAATQPDKTVWVARSTVVVPQYLENVSLPVGVLVYGGFAGTEDPLTFDLKTRNFVANETVVQPTAPANPANPAFTLLGGNRVDGFTIRNGAALQGAAINHASGGNAVVANCVIKNNTSFRGAGIFAQNGNLSVTKCTFSDNTAQDTALFANPAGGGIYAENCSLSVSQSTFTNQIAKVSVNNATSAKGGAIFANEGSICSIERCTFNRCQATGGTVGTVYTWGGAIYVS